MTYQEFPPYESLKQVVRYFWIIQSDSENETPSRYRLFAESSASLVFFQPWGRSILAGHSCTPRDTFVSGKFLMFGACLFPYSVPLLFKLPARELTDNAIDLELLVGPEAVMLMERILTSMRVEDKINILSSYLLEKMKTVELVKRSIHGCVEEIVRTGGRVALRDSMHELGISNRQVERKFQEFVGCSPKVFHRVIRFHNSLRFARRAEVPALTDIAYRSGYYDQSHFIREFKSFSGINPKQYFLLDLPNRSDNFIRLPDL